MLNSDLIILDKEDTLSINGGVSVITFLKRNWLGFATGYVAENYEDIKSGAVSAYNDYQKQ